MAHDQTTSAPAAPEPSSPTSARTTMPDPDAPDRVLELVELRASRWPDAAIRRIVMVSNAPAAGEVRRLFTRNNDG